MARTAVREMRYVDDLVTITVPPIGQSHLATLFLIAASGQSAENLKNTLDRYNGQELSYFSIKIVYVMLPRDYQKRPTNMWFDYTAVYISNPELIHPINLLCSRVSELIHREVTAGIPKTRIVVGGFSLGGCVALHLAYRINRLLAGCLVFSSFLQSNSSVYDALRAEMPEPSNYPKLFQTHGENDNIVPIGWAKMTFDKLEALGVQGRFNCYRASHELKGIDLHRIKIWLMEILSLHA